MPYEEENLMQLPEKGILILAAVMFMDGFEENALLWLVSLSGLSFRTACIKQDEKRHRVCFYSFTMGF